MSSKLIKRLSFAVVILAALVLGIAWYYSGLLLHPGWQHHDITSCNEHRSKNWGKSCGNLETSKVYQVKHLEIKAPEDNEQIKGRDLKGWLVPIDQKNMRTGNKAAFYVHGGGTDRREGVRFIPLFHELGYDVYMFDFGCHGISGCGIKGLTFGAREHRDIVRVYKYIEDQKPDEIIAMGTSVGATSLLVALPEMKKLKAAIAESPMFGFEHFVHETPRSPSLMPGFVKDIAIALTYVRGEFESGYAPHIALENPAVKTPVLLIHSKADDLIPYMHSQKLYDLYQGPKDILITEKGMHAAVYNANKGAFTQKVKAFLKK